MNDDHRLLHSQLLYDYIKFHLGLYLATPPVLAIVATALGVDESPIFRWSMALLVGIYFLAGVSASRLVAAQINVKWSDDCKWRSFGEHAHRVPRRVIQHYFYWIGLIAALLGMAAAVRA